MTKDKSMKEKDVKGQEGMKAEETATTPQEEKKTEETTAPQAEEPQKQEENYKEKYELINDKYLRLTAEFDNYRKRTLREKMELTKSAGESILVNILPVMDDFERALQHMDEAADVTALKEGISLIYNKFKDFLNQNGVKEIEAQKQAFDTDVHEAITKIPAPSKDLKGKVVDCVQKGYTLNEKVIRYSKVVVGE